MNYAGLEKRATEIIGYAEQNGQDIFKMIDSDWLKYRNVGKTTLNFIKQVVDKKRATDTVNKKTLRDEFAMAALTGLLAHKFNSSAPSEGTIEKTFAGWAYYQADAMMEARED